jgi:hypothetical protein
MSECLYSCNCDQEALDDSGCSFHRKVVTGLIDGLVPGPGLGRQFREPDARGKAVIAALIEKEGGAE